MSQKVISKLASQEEMIKSLGRTDNIMAAIALIMLAGFVVTAYGAYWQGKYARYSYKKDTGTTSLALL
jgi:hypothetical protein